MDSEKETKNTIKVFLSYSHKDKIVAGKIKEYLEAHGLEVFLAHEDIEPNVEWEGVILRRLKACDLFIPIISSNFKESQWTDQEMGVAIGTCKEIIPTSIDLAPYGFIGKTQALKLGEKLVDSCETIIEIISRSSLKDKLTDCFVQSFRDSITFAQANRIAKLLEKHAPFTDVQINDIIYGFVTNDQISDGFAASRIVKDLFKKYSDKIEPELKDQFESMV